LTPPPRGLLRHAVSAALRVVRLCSVFEPPASALTGRGARFDPIGGMQEHTGSLTRALARRGVVQVVLTTRPPTAPWRERFAPGATVLRVGLPVRRARQLYAVPGAVLAPLLGRGADLVHVHLGEDLAILPLGALAARPRRLPLIITVHCSPSHTIVPYDARTAVLRRLGGWIERKGEQGAAATIVYTERLAELLAGDGGSAAVHVIPRGVERAPFAAPGERFLPGLPGRHRVVFVGRLVRAKGVDLLVQAAARLRTPGVDVVFVGDGAQRSDVERLARRLGVHDRVHVTGFVPHARVPAVLASADLLVLPSRYEELGTVLVEAMHAGLPVVASRVGGIPEAVEHGVSGLLVAPGDVGELAGAIDAVLSDPALAGRLAAGARANAPGHDLEAVADAVLALYASLAVQRSPMRPRAMPALWPA
jgi:glycosyltransferase involved in cell wall biosynthesis